MVNCISETVSTDYDTSDKLYFEPSPWKRPRIYNKEKPIASSSSYGGQTPLNIAKELDEAGVKILEHHLKASISQRTENVSRT